VKIVSLLLASLMATSFAAQADEADIRRALSGKFPGIEIASVAKTPYAGLYEAVVDGQLIYASEDGKYLFLGNVVELATQRNLTSARNAQLNRVDVSKLPLAQAIKTVNGNGSRVLYVFSDPDCPFCKKLEPELAKLKNVTIYTFINPIPGLHPAAVNTAKQIWCEKNRQAAWDNYMLKGIKPKAAATCKNPIDDIMALGNSLRINGTPTLIFASGDRVPGYMPADKIEEVLAQVKAGK
jgi:thiol:disulfide interchange protein DsbC